MEKIYKEIPDNFHNLKDYLIQEKDIYMDKFLGAENIFFYDTCSLQCHSNSNNRDKIITYVKSRKGIIIITRTVLMELSGDGGNIQNSVIDYLREFYNSNIHIVLFNEEESFHVLKYFLSLSTQECNKLLGNVIGEIASYEGTIYEIRRENPNNIYGRLHNNKNSTDYLYKEFFEFARNYKTSGDNLGEELMFICFCILSRIPLLNKLIFLSNDMKSRSSIISVNQYTKKYNDKIEPYQLTTATLLYKLQREKIIIHKSDLIEMFQKSFNGNVPFYYTDEFSINMDCNKLPVKELVDLIFIKEDFRIYY